MKRNPEDVQPARRALKIYAFDPMLGRTRNRRIVVDVPYEPLERGPRGERVQVVDYDGARDRYYRPVHLDDPRIAVQQGLDCSESDPHFHQQMVYAVAMRVLENFDIALGRRFSFGRLGALRLMPHAFVGRNAYYEPRLHAVLFGYYPVDAANPGSDYPGQTVFTCLSQDIVAHEVTHAVVHRLRPHLLEPSNPDVLAFHEGFSDVVAIFQHFTFPNVLRDAIQGSRADLRSSGDLVKLAAEFGATTGGHDALRSAVDQPDPSLYRRVDEPHLRGSILVGAVFEGFFETYQRRIRDLVRIATGGTGNLPAGDLLPDLVNRIAADCARTAQSVLTMCIRAFDYLPPVDVTFGDYLRALVTADAELVAQDEFELRAAMIEAFRRRGIYPEGVPSPSEFSLLLDPADEIDPIDPAVVAQLLTDSALEGDHRASPSRAKPRAPQRAARMKTSQMTQAIDEAATDESSTYPTPSASSLTPTAYATTLHSYAEMHREALGLHPTLKIQVAGFHGSHRVGTDGRHVVDTVVQFVQVDEGAKERAGGRALRGGSTVVFGGDGKVRYVIARPVSDARADVQRRTLEALERDDAALTWLPPAARARRLEDRSAFAALHMTRAR